MTPSSDDLLLQALAAHGGDISTLGARAHELKRKQLHSQAIEAQPVLGLLGTSDDYPTWTKVLHDYLTSPFTPADLDMSQGWNDYLLLSCRESLLDENYENLLFDLARLFRRHYAVSVRVGHLPTLTSPNKGKS